MDFSLISLINNMDIIKREELIALFDIYGELLTNKQREYFIAYYFEDLSLGEIALDAGVSRNAIYDMLKKTEAILDNYEVKLKIHQKNIRILEIIKNNTSEELVKIKDIIEE